MFDTETFKANPMEFYVGAVDVNTGEMRYHKCVDGGKNDLRWIRASASMPMVSKPVRVEGHKLLDGGIVDSVPYKYMEDLGYDRNVIILTQPAGYMKKKSTALPLAHLMLRKYPVMRDVMDVRHIRYNQHIPSRILVCEVSASAAPKATPTNSNAYTKSGAQLLKNGWKK